METMTMTTMVTLRPNPIRPNTSLYLPPQSLSSTRIFPSSLSSLPNSSVGAPTQLVGQFDPKIPIEAAVTPPSLWYTDPDFYSQELLSVFYRGWQAVGYIEQIKHAGDFFTGRLGSVEFVVCRDENGEVRGFHNVCRHHASILACGSGRKSCFVCPYHVYEKVSIQMCEGGSTQKKDDYDRLGSKALYAFIYPNFMINRYGPWMDTNLVIPLGPRKCKVIFDYFLEASVKDDKDYIERSLNESEKVQMEDIVLCEGVQRGLESPAYDIGRYAPTVEKAMYHFHCLLHESLRR